MLDKLALPCTFFLLFLMQGCGFHVRTAELDSLGFKEIALQCDTTSAWDLCQNLQKELRAHSVELRDDAEFALQLTDIETKERVFTINSDASADEFELTRSLRFTLQNKNNNDSAYSNEVTARRIYRHNSSALLAKDREKATITKALDASLAGEVIRQLTLIRIGN